MPPPRNLYCFRAFEDLTLGLGMGWDGMEISRVYMDGELNASE